MPLYDYKCDCGHVQEEIHGIEDRPVVRCQVCGLSMRKMISAPAINWNDFSGADFLTKKGKYAKEAEPERRLQREEAREAVDELARTMGE